MTTSARVPQRTCIGCRRVRPCTEMVRVTVGADRRPRLGVGSGRGAWLCGEQCFAAACRRRAFARAWRRPIDSTTVQRVGELVTQAMQDERSPGTLSGGVTNERRLTTKG